MKHRVPRFPSYQILFFTYAILAIPTLSWTKNLSSTFKPTIKEIPSELKSLTNTQGITSGLDPAIKEITYQLESLTKDISDDPTLRSGEHSRTPCLVTIFIHGTLRPAEITFTSLQQISIDRVQNTLYAEIVGMMRPNLHFHRAQAMQGLGLIPVTHPEACTAQVTSEKCRTGAHCIVALFEQHYKNDPLIQKKRRYYTFGWNGLLSLKERLGEAKKLYSDLEKEVGYLRSKNLEPYIQIIAFSHGGNVALNLAAIKNEQEKIPNFVVERLILMAIPIQKETDFLINDELFKRTYLLYSTEDTVQTSDIFSTKKDFGSKRTFESRYNFTVPENLTQIRFRLTSSLQRLPKDAKNNLESDELYQLLSTPGIRFKHRDPAHTEFWNIQWGDLRYRKLLPIFPLPVVVFIPTILACLERYCPEARKATFDYCPSLSGARIIQKGEITSIIPFLSDDLFNEMQRIAGLCKPKDYSVDDDKKEEKEALKKAREQILNDKAFKNLSEKKLQTSFFSLSRKLWPHDRPHF